MSVDKKKIKSLLTKQSPSVYGFADLIPYGILLPLVETDGELSVLFEVRAHHLRRQPGEICFPGGKVDPIDTSEEDAAVRETCEELGVQPNQVEVLGSLGILVPPVQIALHTYVGYIHNHEQMTMNKEEVSEVFHVPLAFLRDATPEIHYLHLEYTPDEHFPYEYIPGGREYKFRKREIPEYFYFYEDRIIWGLTGRILHQFLNLIRGDSIDNS